MKRVFATVLVLVVMILAGCSGSGTESSGDVAGTALMPTEKVYEEITEKVDSEGVVTDDVIVMSEDEGYSISIAEGTKAMDEDGDPLSDVTIEAPDDPPPPPQERQNLAVADFGPDGATFDQPIEITMSYDPGDLPEGVSTDDLVIAYYDEETDAWVDLTDIVIDAENHTITGKVKHFTVFAVQVKTPEPTPTPTPTSEPATTPTPTPKEEEVIAIDPEPVMLIAPLTFEYQNLIGTKVWVAGYYGDGSHTADGVGFLVDNYIRLIVNEQLPQHTNIALDGKLPPAELDGLELMVFGEVKDFATAHDAFVVFPTPLVTVEKYVVLDEASPSLGWDDTYSTLQLASYKMPMESSPSAIIQNAVTGNKASECDRALIISGGVDDRNNHRRYGIDVEEKYKKLKELGFTKDQIDVIYYKGATSPVNVGGQNVVDKAATVQNIKDTIKEYVEKMPASCTLTLFVTDHGTGYNDTQGWHGARPALPGSSETGKTYPEGTFKIDLKHKVYKSTQAFNVNGKMWFGARDENGKWNLYMRQGANWVRKVTGRSGDTGIISETEVGVDLNGDGDATDGNYGINVSWMKNNLGNAKHNNNQWDTDHDGTADVRARWVSPPGRYYFERLDGGTWKKMGEDTSGDFIIDGTDGGVDWNLDGDKNDQVGFHEGINLKGNEVLWDDQLAGLLKPLADKGVHILVEMMQCFSGGFVSNLQGTVEKIVAACAEDKKSYSRSPEAGTYPGVRWVNTFELEFAKSLEGIDIESWNSAYDKAKKKDTERWTADGGSAISKNDYQLWEKPVFTSTTLVSEDNGTYSLVFKAPDIDAGTGIYDFEIIYGLQKPRWTGGAEALDLPEGLQTEAIPGGIRIFSEEALGGTPWFVKIKGHPGAKKLRIQLTDREHKTVGYIMPETGASIPETSPIEASINVECEEQFDATDCSCVGNTTITVTASDPNGECAIHMAEVFVDGQLQNRSRYFEGLSGDDGPQLNFSQVLQRGGFSCGTHVAKLRIIDCYGRETIVEQEFTCGEDRNSDMVPVTEESIVSLTADAQGSISGYEPECTATLTVNWGATAKSLFGIKKAWLRIDGTIVQTVVAPAWSPGGPSADDPEGLGTGNPWNIFFPLFAGEEESAPETEPEPANANSYRSLGGTHTCPVTPGSTVLIEVIVYASDCRYYIAAWEKEISPCPPAPVVYSGPICFAFDTLVLMADGSTRQIIDIQNGDSVYAFNVETGEVVISEVAVTHSGQADYYYMVNGGLKVTPPHPFFTTDRGWVPVEDLQIGDQIKGIDGTTIITSIERVDEGQDIYNIIVEEFGNFFVSADGIDFYLVAQGS